MGVRDCPDCHAWLPSSASECSSCGLDISEHARQQAARRHANLRAMLTRSNNRAAKKNRTANPSS